MPEIFTDQNKADAPLENDGKTLTDPMAKPHFAAMNSVEGYDDPVDQPVRLHPNATGLESLAFNALEVAGAIKKVNSVTGCDGISNLALQ